MCVAYMWVRACVYASVYRFSNCASTQKTADKAKLLPQFWGQWGEYLLILISKAKLLLLAFVLIWNCEQNRIEIDFDAILVFYFTNFKAVYLWL